MTDKKRILLGVLVWTIVVSALHLSVNVNWAVVMNDSLPEDKRKLNLAYIPVT